MKAIVIQQPGGTDVLSLEELPDPTPGPKDVVIAVSACGVCFHDIATRNGTLKAGVKMPCVPGHEIAGTVAAIGRAVRGFKPGDRVATTQRYHICGFCKFCRTGREPLCAERKFLGDWGMVGGYAEYVAVEDDNVAIVPEGVSLEDASIAACAIGTVLHAIRNVARLQIGEKALITGAGGGLGMHAIQLAHLAGAYVIAQTTSHKKIPLIREMGADAVVLSEHGDDFSEEVKKATGGSGVDVVIDNVGSILFHSTRRSFAAGGRWVLVGQLGGEFVQFNPAQLFLKGISMLSATSTTRVELQDCLRLLDQKRIKSVISESLPLMQAGLAHGKVESGAVLGRILLKPNL